MPSYCATSQIAGFVRGIIPKKYVDLLSVSGYIMVFYGHSESLGLFLDTSAREPKSGKTSIFGVRSRIYSG